MALALLLVLPSPSTLAADSGPPVAVVALSEWAPVAPPGVSEAAGEWVELEVVSGGSLAGIVLTDNDGADDFVFPEALAGAGDRIVVANGREPPAGIGDGAAWFPMNKSSWTFDNTGDDVVLRSASGGLLDRWTFGSGGAVDPLDDGEPFGGTVAFVEAPPAGDTLAVAAGRAGAARPTPGAANALLEPAPVPGLLLEGVLWGGGALAVLVCNEGTASFEATGWWLEAAGDRVPFSAGPLGSGSCQGWAVAKAAPLRTRLEELGPSGTVRWQEVAAVPSPTAGSGWTAVDPWGGPQALEGAAPAAGPPGGPVTWWQRCACADGWTARRVEPVPAAGLPFAAWDLSVFPAGPDLERAFVSFADAARRTLWVNTYALTADTAAAALSRAAYRGVEVRLLVEPAPVGWGAVPGGMPEALRQGLGAAGVQVQAFAAGAPLPARDHAKYAVADGERVLVLTENLVGAAFGSSEPNTGYGVTGRSPGLAGELGRLFAWDWTVAGGAPPNATGGAAAPAGPDGAATASAALLVSPGPLDPWVELVDRANRSLMVESLSADPGVLGPDGALGAALLRAAARGVDVRVLLAPDPGGDGAGQAAVALATAGASRSPSFEVRVDPRLPSNASKMHAKVLVVDGEAFILGSHNLVSSAFDSNREVSLLVSDPGAAAWLADRLRTDFDRALPAPAEALAVEEGGTIGTPGAPTRAPSVPLTTGAMLVGGAAAFAWALLPQVRGRPGQRRGGRTGRRRGSRRVRGRSRRRRRRGLGRGPRGADGPPGGPPPPAAARDPGAPDPQRPPAFALRMGEVPAPEPPLPPPPEVRVPPADAGLAPPADAGFPPSAFDRMRGD